MTQIKGLVSGTTALLLWSTAFGASSVTVNIERQGMAGALSEFAKQSGMQLLYPSDGQVERLMAKEVVGTYPAEVALSQLLGDSGLKYQFVNARTVAIGSSAEPPESAKNSPPAVHASETAGSIEDEPQSVPSSKAARDSSSEEEVLRKGIPEVLVKGSRSLNADIERTPDDIQPYVVFSREMIARSGAETVEELLRAELSMNYSYAAQNQQGRAGVGNQSEFALRGLGYRETLILIDGRRVGMRGRGTGAHQPDLNALPLAAIERIEVLPASASGIYGGSATGGVINVVLRRDYSGIETTIAYEATSEGGGRNRRVDLAGGFSIGEQTSIQLVGSHSSQDGLFLRDRSYIMDYRKRLAPGLPQLFPPLGYTTNIRSQTGAALTLKPKYGGVSLNSPIAHVPVGYAGPESDGAQGLLQGAGSYNATLASTSQRGGAWASLVAPSTTQHLGLTLRHTFANQWEGFLDLAAASNRSEYRATSFTGNFILPASAEGNPFSQSILVSVPMLDVFDEFDTRTSSYRALAGLIMDLGKDWRAEMNYAWDRNDFRQKYPSRLLSTDAATAIQRGEIDIFKDVNEFTVPLSSHVLPPREVAPSHSIQRSASLRVSGPVFDLPGGQSALSMLIEGVESDYGEFSYVEHTALGSNTESYSEQSSSDLSVYAELRLPVLSDRYNFRWLKLLEVQTAVRYERHEHVPGIHTVNGEGMSPLGKYESDSIDPTIGMRIIPLSGWVFRASYSTGFLSPNLNHLIARPSTLQPAASISDPKRNNEPLGEVLVKNGGGGQRLEPERSISRSLGVIYTPLQLAGFRLSIDWTQIKKRDAITALSLSQERLELEDELPGIIVRAPVEDDDPYGVGPIIEFDGRFRNVSRALSESYDLAIDYEYPTRTLGTWMFQARATRLLHSFIQHTPNAPTAEDVGLISHPKWKGSATLAWRRGSWGFSWTARYLDQYWLFRDRRDHPIQGSNRVPSATFHDLMVSYDAGEQFGGVSALSGIRVTVGARNVFGKEPRFYALDIETGSDPWSDPRMTRYYIKVSKPFCVSGC